jgi:multiple antibiotic resistance protein
MGQTELAVNFFIALFALLDPVGNVPIFAVNPAAAMPYPSGGH